MIFHTLKYKNFLATGNVWNEYKLDQHPHTLIIGTNGAGKTTMLDALCFGLYGKPFRAVTKPSVINSINQKNLVVEITFTTQSDQYLIRRGMKPNIFDILCNGVPLPAFPSLNEMQDHLEKYILKCNYKAFTQVVILGSSSYVPFMRLTPAARREILEDVLDIEVFSVMQSLVRDRLTATKDALTKAQSAVSVIESQHALAKTYAEQWTQQQQKKREQLTAVIEDAQSVIAGLVTRHDAPVDDEAAWAAMVPKIDDWQEKLTKANKLVSKFSAQVQHLEHSSKFFHDNDQCPMCTQVIETTFKSDQLQTVDTALAKVKSDQAEAQTLVTMFTQRLATAREAQRSLTRLTQDRQKIQEQIRSLQRDIQRANEQIAETMEAPPAPPTELGDLDAANTVVTDCTYQKHVHEQTLLLLKDTGIRTRIIQQYLPTINRTVNEYLQSLNFAVQFTLDDQFNETIKSRHRDEFSYENFSEGEKRRIDLALVLTWRAIARMKNSVFTNMLIFDEVFDSSLDSAGTEEFLALLHTMGDDTNVFVISHKTEMLLDKFSHVISVTKDRGFSVVNDL